MRVIIKNADFSSVSIGKVTTDYSFSYKGEQVNNILDNPVDDWSVVIAADPNAYPAGAGNNGNTTFYLGSNGATEYQVYADNPNRLTSDEIEVIEGMVITATPKAGSTLPNNMPTIICYNAAHELLAPNVAASWSSPYTIPAGVKYIKFQFAGLSVSAEVAGVMPV